MGGGGGGGGRGNSLHIYFEVKIIFLLLSI